MFNQYPYLNINDLNLDFILNAIREMKYEVTNFVSINAIKYANPIQWNITSQYEKNTIVIDPVTGTAYISVAPVPSGVSLTRPEYWTVVFDLGSFVTRAAQNFTSHWESETTTTATFPSTTGAWLVWGDVLYKALTNIIAGDTYVVGSNIEHFTIEDLYNAYLNTIANILAIIGDLADLNTTDKSNIVNAINETLGVAKSKVFYADSVSDMLNLNCEDGDTVYTKGFYTNGDGGDAHYNITSAGTPDNIFVFAMNNGTYANLIYDLPLNVLKVGVKNDNSVDVSTTVNALNVDLYFPIGIYRVENTLQFHGNIKGEFSTSLEYLASGKYTRFEDYTLSRCIESLGVQCTVENFMVHMNGDGDALVDNGSGWNRFEGISVENLQNGVGITINHGNSRAALIHKCTINGDKTATHYNTGIYYIKGTDCNIMDTAIMNVQIGIRMVNCLCQMTNIHIWCGAVVVSDNTWWNNTQGIRCEGNSYVIASDIYIDCAYIAFGGSGRGNIMVTNLTMIGDESGVEGTGGVIPTYDDGHIFAPTILTNYQITVVNAHYFGSQKYWKELFRAIFGSPILKNFYINHGYDNYASLTPANVICCDHNDVHGFSRDLWDGINNYKEILRIKKITAFSGFDTCMIETSTNDVFRLYINANSGACEVELLAGTLPSIYIDSSESGYYVVYMNDGSGTSWYNVTLETQPLHTIVDYWHNTYNNEPLPFKKTTDISAMTAATVRNQPIVRKNVSLTVSASVDSVYSKYYVTLPAISGVTPLAAVCLYQYPELIVEHIYYDGTNYIATLQGNCAGWNISLDIIYV